MTRTGYYPLNSEVLPAGPVAEFIVPDWGDKVNSGIGLSYRPARLHRQRPVRQPYAGVDYIPQSGIMNSASGKQGEGNCYGSSQIA